MPIKSAGPISFLAVALIIAGLSWSHGAVAQSLPMLHQSGLNIEDSSNNVVQLRGISLGDWLVMEPWMCPAVSDSDENGSFPDMHSIISELDSRFGVSEEQSLISTYQNAYITAADIANIKAQGFNVIRVPVWWGDFYTLGSNTGGTGTWRSDAFTELDNVINEAAADGIYTIVDMHGAIGQQSEDHSTGWQGQNNYWTSSADQAATNTMWETIATHYNGNSNVAGYDILNEPDSAPNDAAVITAYAGIMNAIRSVDSSHMCFIEGTFDQWDWSMLPNPTTEGWTNVAYEMHQYNGSGSGNYSAAQGQVTDWFNHVAYDVPDYVGEFNPAVNSIDSATGLTWWQDVVSLYSGNNISWSIWAYKAGGNATEGSNWNNNWGLYQPNQSVSVPTTTIPTPSIATDSSSTIQTDWAALTTSNYFVLNSNISSAIPATNPPTPSAPTSLTPTPGNAQVALSWPIGKYAATYNVYRGTSPGGEGSVPIATEVVPNTYTDTGLTNGVTYYYKVATVNTSGTSGLSVEAFGTPSGPTEGPYGGTPQGVPGAIFADTYDTGGQGVGYNIGTNNGTDNTWRTTSDGVDLESNSDSISNGADVGWTSSGQWFRYTVNAASAGTYTVGCRIASGASGGTLDVQTALGSDLSGPITLPGTGGWQTWQTVTASVTLSAGVQTLMFYQTTGGYNINYLSFTLDAPTAPTGLTATAGSAQVALSWSGSSFATSYDVYRSTTSGGEGSTPVQAGITGTTYTDNGLTNGSTYYYTVSAVNGGGTSALSAEASATPNLGSDATVVLFQTFDTGTSGAWQGVYGSDGFDVFNDTDANNPTVPGYAALTIAHASNALWKSPTALTPQNGYLLQTTAPGSTLGMLGVDYTSVATGSNPNSPPTGMTYDVNVTDGNTHEIAFYAYDYGAVGRGETISVIDSNPLSPTYKQILDQEQFTAGLYPQGGYLVWTIGGHVLFNVTKDAGPNAVVNGVFFGGSSPSAVSNAPVLQSAVGGNNSAALSWTAPSLSVSGYWIYRGATAGGEGATPINSSAVTGTSFTDTGLTNGTTYYYTVAAQNAAGTSAMSNELSAKPSLPVPAAPTLSAAAGVGQVVVTWNSVTYAASYNLYRTAGNGTPGSEVLIKAGATSPYTDTTLASDKTFYYKVYAVNASGSSAASNEVEAEPVGASATFIGTDSTTKGSWKGVYGAQGYNVINDTEAGNPKYPSYLTGLGTLGKSAITWAGPAMGTSEWLETAGYNGTTDKNRVAGVWYSAAPTGFTVSLTFKAGSGPHPVEFYLLDWNGTGRSESITVADAAGVVLNAQQVTFPRVTESGTGNGAWYSYTFTGNVTITFTKTGASPNSVLSGICFN